MNRATVLFDVIIVTAMLACVAVGLVQLGQQITSGWRADDIPVFSVFVALEAAVSTRLLRARPRLLPWYVLRAAEAALIFFAARSLLGLRRGPDFVIAYDDFYGGIDTELLGRVALVGLIWLLSWHFTRLLIDLDAEITIDLDFQREAEETRQSAWQSLASWVLLTGLMLIGGAIPARLDSRQVEGGAALSGTHVLIFFGLGVLLLSKTRLAMLRAAWQSQCIPFDGRLTRRWLILGAALLTVLGFITTALPTQYPLGLFATLSYLFTWIGAVIQLIIFAVVFILAYILSLFFPQVQLPAAPALPLPPVEPPTTPTSVAVPPISEFVQALIFWALFLIVTGYVLRQYVLSHPQLGEAARRLPGWPLISRWWRQLRAFFGGLGHRINDLREARRQTRSLLPTRSAAAPRRWISLRRLSPRERVQFYYAALLRRGDERGLPRAPAQTPYEYARLLRGRAPEADRELEGLTVEFLEARYTSHDISIAQANLAQRYWARLKQFLRK